MNVSLTVTNQPMTAGGLSGTFTGRLTGVLTLPPPPVASIVVATTTPAPGESIHFSAETLAGGPVAGWAWDFGDGTTSAEADLWHAWDAPGAYAVRLTVTGPGGTDGKQLVITVG